MRVGRVAKKRTKGGTPSMPPLWMRVLAYLLCVVLTDGPLAWAMPQGGRIASGSGTIATSGKTMTIRQKSPTLTINWNSFNIGKSQTVQFLQPGASSIALNQIGGVSASYIYGHLLANGQIFLINPSGIVFGPGAQVDVGGLIASTLDLVKNGFANTGTLSFSGSAPGTITNAGILKALPGGYIALLGQSVTNTGTITAPRGTVTFGAGNRIDLDFNGGSLVSLAVTQNTLDSIAANGGLVSAEGGKILLSAGAQDSIVKSVVNNTGVLEAQTVADRNGEIVLLSGLASGTTNVSGTLDASAPSGGNGGTIETSGSRVNVADGTVVTTSAPGGKTGSWTLDPASFYIGANTTGSASSTLGQVTNYQDISGSELGTLLASTNVIVDSTQGREGALGNIYVDNPVSWSSTYTLTLNAVNNIEINSALTNTASGYSNTQTTGFSTPSPLPNTPLLILRADDMDLGGTATNTSGGGVPSGNGTVAVNSGGSISVAGPVEIYYNPTNYSTRTAYTNGNSGGSLAAYMLISSLNDLTYLSANQNSTILSNNYALNTNLSYPTNNTTSFTPFGNSTTNYTGYFNGLNHSISNLYQNYLTGTDGGFIGVLGTSGWVRNLDLINETLVGNSSNMVGGLVGVNNGTVENVTVTGSISSNYDGSNIWLGGLVGANAGTVAGSTADVAMSLSIASSQNDNVGGFVGQNQNNGSFAGLITSSVAEGSVFVVNGQSAGGFDGASNGGSTGATIENSYATGSVTGTSSSTNFGTGGFAGVLLGTNTIENSYSLGAVSGSSRNSNASSMEPAGGFIGNIWSGASNTLSNNAWNSSAFVANSGAQVSGGIGYVQNGATYSASNQVVLQTFSRLETPADVGGLGTISTAPLVSTTSTLVSAGGNTTVTTTQGAPDTWVFINPNGTLASSTQNTAAATTPMLASEYSQNIATLHQLELMNLAPQGSYTLLESLNAAATGSSGGDVFGSQGFVRVGSGSTPFTGTFNGGGNVLSNLTINDSSNAHVGLFGSVGSGGTVENLTLANANILSTSTGTVFAGGIAGANSGTISGVSVTGTVEGSDNTGSMTGGVAGYNNGTLTNGWSGATVAGSGGVGYAGGVTGWNDTGGTVEDSYFTGILGGASLMGGIAGKNAGTVTTTYTASVEGYNGMSNGALVGNNTGTLENSYYDAGLFPNAYGTNSGTTTNVNGLMPSQMNQTGNFGSFVFSSTPGATGNSWVIVDINGSLNNAGGTNGSLLPMLASESQGQIGTMHQLELMNMNLSGNYSLAASLDGNVTGVTGNGSDVFGSAGFVRVGGGSYASTPTPFTGTFNGNNRTISNLTINDATNMSVGLFGNLQNATVENLVLLDPNIQSTNPVNLGYNNNRILMGGIAGNMTGGTIENVGVDGGLVTVANGQNQAGVVVGGVVGNAGSGTIENVWETTPVSVTSVSSTGAGGKNINVGGIVANTGSSLTLENVYATGKISESGAGQYSGGILGADNGVTVTDAYYSGVVSASGSGSSGALWGTNSGTTTDAYWNSTLTASNGGSGGSGLTSSQMQTASNFSGWTFTATPGLSGNNWVIVDTNGTLNNASGSGATTPMLASEYSQNIRTLHQLELMNMAPMASYQLENNLGASPTSSTTGGDVFGSAGFVRVGGSSTPFSGSFNGNGHAISNLTINDATNTNVGLFGKATNATIENLLLESPTVNSTVTSASQTADPYAVGSVVGWLDGGTMSNVGVVWGTVSSQIEGSVSGILAGELGASATIENSYVDHGTLTFSSTGGNSSYYNSGNSWGGLIAGYNLGTVQNAYTTGTLILGNAGSGGNSISMGGIVGLQGSGGSIANTWDTVTLEDGSTATGGGGPAGLLVGNLAGGSISNSWGEGNSTNVVNGTSYNSDSSANTAGSGTLGSSSGTVGSNVGIPSSGLTASDYAGLNFTTTPGLSGNNWVMVDTNGTLNNASGAGGATGPMLSSEYSRSIQTVHQLELMNMAPGGVYTLGGTVDASATSSSNQRLFAAGTFVRVGGTTKPFTGI
ncbi:MAG: two-partner secretion domain-containing protein [Leptospirales bacterium]